MARGRKGAQKKPKTTLGENPRANPHKYACGKYACRNTPRANPHKNTTPAKRVAAVSLCSDCTPAAHADPGAYPGAVHTLTLTLAPTQMPSTPCL
eukprot:362216-Chlamydomonas_euryale.AAC.4